MGCVEMVLLGLWEAWMSADVCGIESVKHAKVHNWNQLAATKSEALGAAADTWSQKTTNT